VNNTNKPANGATNQTMPAQLTWEYVNKVARTPAEYNKLSREQQVRLSEWILDRKNRA
jgi:hypothetical protein